MSNPKKPKFGTKVLDSINERIEPAEASVPPAVSPSPPAEPVWVPFTTAVTQQTYLMLKQAEYWVPGFTHKEFIEQAIQEAFAKLPEATHPLPPELERKLLQTNKKLQGYNPYLES